MPKESHAQSPRSLEDRADEAVRQAWEETMKARSAPGHGWGPEGHDRYPSITYDEANPPQHNTHITPSTRITPPTQWPAEGPKDPDEARPFREGTPYTAEDPRTADVFAGLGTSTPTTWREPGSTTSYKLWQGAHGGAYYDYDNDTHIIVYEDDPRRTHGRRQDRRVYENDPEFKEIISRRGVLEGQGLPGGPADISKRYADSDYWEEQRYARQQVAQKPYGPLQSFGSASTMKRK